MEDFRELHRNQFNKSQTEILNKVADMPANEILLIQGPPGTGKTHTIAGIVSMVINAGASKVHVCAPSNAAVDEILHRLSS